MEDLLLQRELSTKSPVFDPGPGGLSLVLLSFEVL